MARRYYYPGDEAGVLERVRNRVFRKPVPDFPKTIVIETQFGCNASCVFCQYSQLRDKLPKGRMSVALFEKIAGECAGRPVERFILCLDNEPLLDTTLAEKYALLRQHCPLAVRNLTTNASLLTAANVDELIGAGLVNELFLSVNGASREVYEKLMGLPYDKVMGNLEYLCTWLRQHPDVRRTLRVRVNAVRTRLVEPELPAMARRWEAEGFEMHVIGMDSRGNQLDMKNLPGERMKPNATCRRLFHTMVLTWEGHAVLCCVDYRRAVKLGNVQEQTVYEIWNGSWATLLRKEYLAKDFSHLPICATCKIN
ncbi:MAG: SPASM domain-containing protein [Planctomycetota bacterium]|nr:SPASM domain-containing protein [Planctomycetota bacterium]